MRRREFITLLGGAMVIVAEQRSVQWGCYAMRATTIYPMVVILV
jgi:hypothetical protein